MPPDKAGGIPSEAVLRRVRIPFVQRARLTNAGRELDAFLVDLGLLGVFVELSEPLQVGDRVEVRFPLPGNEIPLTATCRVAWWHPRGKPPKQFPPGAGLEFVEISDSDRDRLRNHLVDHHRRHGGRRRFARPWPGSGST